MDLPIVAAIISIFTLLNVNSYFVGLSKTPQYTIFQGAVHFSLDYFYYISFITQGKLHWFTGGDLYTAETVRTGFLYWVYIFAGHLGHMMHLDQPIIYQIMVIFGSIVYLTIAWKLASLVFPKARPMRYLTYILFIVSNAYPRIYFDKGHWIYSYYYPWDNFGHPFIRLTNVPHLLFIQCAIMAALLVGAWYWQKRKSSFIAVLLFLGPFLASMQPLQWAFVTCVLGVSGIFAWAVTFGRNKTHVWKNEIFYVLSPSIAFFLLGVPPALFLKHLVTIPPYDYAAHWEAWQQIRIPFLSFIRLSGPVFFMGLVALPLVLKKIKIETFPLIFYSIVSVATFYTTIPDHMGILNQRYLSVVIVFTCAYGMTLLLSSFTHIFWRKHASIAAWILAFCIIAITIQVTIQQFEERTDIALADVNIYLPLGAKLAYDVAEKTIGVNETVLVSPPLPTSFAALTGKHVFVSNQFTTIDYDKKIKESDQFFYDRTQSREDKSAWLASHHIAYVLTYTWTPIDLTNISVIYQNGYAILYKVKI